MHIRPLTREDVAAVSALCVPLGYRATESDVSARLGPLAVNRDHLVIVADLNGVVVGWLHARKSDTLTSPARVEVIGLVVDAHTRHAGVGRALMGHAEAWAQSLGAGAIRVRVAVTRDAALAFYQALGYRAAKRQEVLEKAL